MDALRISDEAVRQTWKGVLPLLTHGSADDEEKTRASFTHEASFERRCREAAAPSHSSVCDAGWFYKREKARRRGLHFAGPFI